MTLRRSRKTVTDLDNPFEGTWSVDSNAFGDVARNIASPE